MSRNALIRVALVRPQRFHAFYSSTNFSCLSCARGVYVRRRRDLCRGNARPAGRRLHSRNPSRVRECFTAAPSVIWSSSSTATRSHWSWPPLCRSPVRLPIDPRSMGQRELPKNIPACPKCDSPNVRWSRSVSTTHGVDTYLCSVCAHVWTEPSLDTHPPDDAA